MNFEAHFKNKFIWYLLLGLFFFFAGLSFFAEATADSGDGIRHYLISRFSWIHPSLLLNSWGKPFFTLCSSPFSQFGLFGMYIFNILSGIGSAFFAYKIARILKFNYTVLVILFLLFTPIYFFTLHSGLTEPFFGFILIFSVYLMLTDRYLWASIIISFLPFIRTEGFILLPLFFIIQLYRKKYIPILFLGTGTLLYSIAGYFYYHDFFWILNQNPYTGSNREFYGSGHLLTFVYGYKTIWGILLTFLFCAGLLSIIITGIQSIRDNTFKESKLPEEFILIFGSFVLYFIAHSVMWWQGLANSLGLLRVLAAVMPASALICLRGFNFLMRPVLRRKPIVEYSFLALILFFLIRGPFAQHYFPYKLDPEQALMRKAADWYNTSPYTHHKLYYIYPVFAHFTDIDPFDKARVGELWSLLSDIEVYGIDAMPDSTIIFWDSHFGPNECVLPLDYLMHNPHFHLIKVFKAEEAHTTFKETMFKVYVFIRHRKAIDTDTLGRVFYDYETPAPELKNIEALVTDVAFSGNTASSLSATNEFSAIVEKRVSDIPQGTLKTNINFMLWDINPFPNEALTVFSIEDTQGKNLYWEGIPITSEDNHKPLVWREVFVEILLSIDMYPSDAVVKFYVWNKERNDFYIDDFEIIYSGFR